MRFWFVRVMLAAWATAADPLTRDSPQSSVTAFLQAFRSKDYQRASRYLDLRKLPANQRSKQGAQLAQELGQVLENDTRFDEAALSQKAEGDRETVASFTAGGKTLEVQLQHVTLRPGVSIWQFPAETVELIPQLARLASDSPVEKYLPAPLVSWRFMDTALWRWIALLLIAAALSALSSLVCRIVFLSTAPALRRLEPPG
jgi:MscS family membrane protein